MPLDSPQFLFIFFPAVFVLTLFMRGSARLQNLTLLSASILFYTIWTGYFVLLLLFVSIVSYVAGILLDQPKDTASNARREAIFWGTIVFFIVILIFFKLSPLFASTSIIFPIGISFYTFQNIGYVIEVRRSQIKAIRSLSTYLLFSAYFPLVLSGPIERSRHLLPQLEQPRYPNQTFLERGIGLIILGLVQKIVLAKIAYEWSAPIFNHFNIATAYQVVVAIYLYAIQIYTDFAGYTNMVRGVSYCLGIELFENFHQPYLSSSVTEFWQRWHVSLSTWFREFLFFPISRLLLRLSQRKYTNAIRAISLVATMLLIGLWHGISLNFVLWGLLHGILLALHNGPQDKAWSVKRICFAILTFHAVAYSWLFFRLEQPADIMIALKQLFRPDNPANLFKLLPITLLLYMATFGIDIGQRIISGRNMNVWIKASAWGLGLFLIYIFWSAEYQAFVYFKF